MRVWILTLGPQSIQVRGLVDVLMKDGAGGGIPRATVAQLSSCVMSRLSPRLFPERPLVSFMLQVLGGVEGVDTHEDEARSVSLL